MVRVRVRVALLVAWGLGLAARVVAWALARAARGWGRVGWVMWEVVAWARACTARLAGVVRAGLG